MRIYTLCFVVLGFSLSPVGSQSVPVPLPSLRLSTYGEVHTIAEQADGKILVGGIFDSVNDIPRTNIARINPDGSLDFSWAPQLDGPCYELLIDGQDLYIAGDFSTVNGELFEDFAKVSLIDGSADPQLERNVFDLPVALAPFEQFDSSNPFDLDVYQNNQQAVLQFIPDGDGAYIYGVIDDPAPTGTGTPLGISDLNDASEQVILTAGTFPFYGTSYSSFWINSNGTINFDVQSNDLTESPAEHFSRRQIALLWQDLDPSRGLANPFGSIMVHEASDRIVINFRAVSEYFTEAETNNFNDAVAELFFDGRIRLTYPRCDLTDALTGISPGGLIYNPLTDFPTDFSENRIHQHASALAQNEAHVFVGSNNGRIRKIDKVTGDPVESWTPLPRSQAVEALVLIEDWLFAGFGGDGIAKISPTESGGEDPDFSPTNNWVVQDIASVEDELIIVPGIVSLFSIQPVKFDKNTGARDLVWSPQIRNNAGGPAVEEYESEVRSVTEKDGWVYFGGRFDGLTSPQSIDSTSLARVSLAGSGSGDPDWISRIDIGGGTSQEPFPVFDLLASDKGVLVGGAIGTIDGDTRLGVSRLDLISGQADPSLPVQVQTSGAIGALAMQRDGSILIGGDFLFINGVERRHLARLMSNGELDGSWAPEISRPVTDLAVGRNELFAAISPSPTLLNIDLVGDQWDEARSFEDDRNDFTIHSLVTSENRVYFTHNAFAEDSYSEALRLEQGLEFSWLPEVTDDFEISETVVESEGSTLFVFRNEEMGAPSIRRYDNEGDSGIVWETAIDSGDFSYLGRSVSLSRDGDHLYLAGRIGSVDGTRVFGLARLAVSDGLLDESWIPLLAPTSPPSQVVALGEGVWINCDGKLLFVDASTAEVGDAKTSSSNFDSIQIIEQTEDFTINFTVTPSSPGVDFQAGLSNGPASSSSDLATVIRFGPNNAIEARNGEVFSSENLLGYQASGFYEIEMQLNFSSSTYNVIVTPSGEEPVVIARDYSFQIRDGSSQVGINQLDHLSFVSNEGSHIVSNVGLKEPSTFSLREPQIDGPVNSILANGASLVVAGDFSAINQTPAEDIGLIRFAAAPVAGLDAATNRIILARNPASSSEVSHFRIYDIVGGSLFLADGETDVSEGDFITTEQGLFGLVWVPNSSGDQRFQIQAALTDDERSAGAESTSVELSGGVLQPVIRFDRLKINSLEDVTSIEIDVVYSGSNSASIDMEIFSGSADPVNFTPSPAGDYFDPGPQTLHFNGPGTKSLVVALWDDSILEADEVFFVKLSNPRDAVLGDSDTARVTIIENDVFGETAPGIAQAPGAKPPSNGQLRVNLVGDDEKGEWRLLGEVAWRPSSDDGGPPASGLITGNYEIEFAPVGGFAEPSRITVPINGANSTPVESTGRYASLASTNLGVGTLTVDIGPDDIAKANSVAERGQWKRKGETLWKNSGEPVNVVAGTQTVEFKTVSGRSTPATRTIFVKENQVNGVTGVYLVKSDIPGARDTEVLPFDENPGVVAEPYVFSGQIATEQGFGSGVATQEHTVLTAAHVIFDDIELAYVDEVFWFHQRHKGDYEPPAMVPRGWYIFDSYADQRALDVMDPASGPGIGSVESQNDDAAVLYFLEPAARGGFGGYQFSESTANRWLLGTAEKFLVGYPVEGIVESDLGRMHATSRANDRYILEQDFVWSTDAIQSSPGSSGGPIYVETTSGDYFPVAIYLGGSGDSTVRAINNNIVSLMNLAETAGSGGGNNTGGGAIYVSRRYTEDELTRGFVTVNIAGSSAGRWRVVDAGGTALSEYLESNQLVAITPGDLLLELEPIAGRESQGRTIATVFDGQTTEKSLAYIETVDDWLQSELVDQGIATENGILDDYDNDGLNHLLELAFNLSPRFSDLRIIAEDSGDSGLPSIRLDLESPQNLRVEYLRRKDGVTPGLVYSVEFASSLGGPWTTFTGDEETRSIDAVWERVVVLADGTVDSEPVYFGRVRVTSGDE